MSALAIATPIAATPRRRIAGTTARSGTSAKSEPVIIHVAVFRELSGNVRNTRERTIAIATALRNASTARIARACHEEFLGPHGVTSYVHHVSIVKATARHGAFRANPHGSRSGSE